MDPFHRAQEGHGDADHDDRGTTSWMSVCPRGVWKVQRRPMQRGSQPTVCNHGEVQSSHCRPRLGSVCRVRVQLKTDEDQTGNSASAKREEKLSDEPEQSASDAPAAAFQRRHDCVLQVPLGHWTTVRLGEGQCDITEACVEMMRAGEKCEILLSPVGNAPDTSSVPPAEENLPFCATVELQAFTPGRDSWEMPPSEKWQWVKSHKERGGVRFRSGDVWGAADSYSRALKLLITLHGHVRAADREERERETEGNADTNGGGENATQRLPLLDELRTVKAELHSNLSLCQLRLNQPERAKASAAKATELEPGGAKAWYRLGRACQTVNELEEARQAFRKLLTLQPESPAALKALKDIASREKATNAQLGQRLSKMFS